MAHEMSHISDRDMLLGTLVATLVGAVVLVSEFFLRFWFWGLGGRRRGGGGGGGDSAGIIQLAFLAIGLILLILAPVFAQIIKMAMSRRREYLADANGALLTRYPPGLASALRKIGVAPHAMRSANNATAHLWLDQPSRFPGEKTGFMERLFSTHPPIQDRIRILEEM